MMIRTQMGQIYVALSPDGGDTWSDAKPWGVRSPESPATVRRIPATGDLLLVWNDNYEPGKEHSGKRRPLTAAISHDDGQTWKHHRNLEDRGNQSYAYTSLTFDRDRVLLSYYVGDDKTGRISSKFRSLPLTWFYEKSK
jgi:sialidase-1